MHTVLNKETKHLIGAKEVFCDEEDRLLLSIPLEARLIVFGNGTFGCLGKKKQIAGAGLDVYSLEPLK